MVKQSTILLNKDVIELLKKARDHPRQTYNELLEKMVRIFIKLKERNQYDEFLHKIQQDKMKELWDNKEDKAWDAGSFRKFMDMNFFRKVGIDGKRIHFLDGRAGDFDEECTKYEGEIVEAGGIDFQVLGLGRNGHIGFDEPGSSLKSRTRRIDLSMSTRRANARDFGGKIAGVPRSALTMGIGTIMDSRKILLIAAGGEKAEAVRCLIKGKISKKCPATVLRRHGNVTVLLDRAAAGKI